MEDYKEKYEMALERAKKNYDVAQDLCNGSQIGVERFKNTLTNIFPELGESEYERIRKRLIDLIYKVYAFTNYITCVEYENIIAWLEKQGEQKPEKKELKIIDWSKHIKYEPNSPSIIEQKPTWSEEDENMANDLIEGCLSSEKAYHLAHTSKEIADWLKSIKDRMKGKELEEL